MMDAPTTAPTPQLTLEKLIGLNNIRMPIYSDGPGNQAIGYHSGPGSLIRASQLDLDSPYYKVVNTNQREYYGARIMIDVIEMIGRAVTDMLSGYRIWVNAISDYNGGKQIVSKSHQNGLDADISYIVQDQSQQLRSIVLPSGKLWNSFHMQEQWELWKKLINTNLVFYIFVSSEIKQAACQHARATGEFNRKDVEDTLKRLYVVRGHANHWHMRLRCLDNPRCKGDDVNYSQNENCK